MVYFVAKWNPACKMADEDVKYVSEKYPQITLIKIDCDTSPQVKEHYSVRAEPQFIFCFYGDQVIRQTGSNKEKLLEKAEMMMEI